MTSRIISVESAPSCTPKLPPARRTGAGALQLPGMRHEAKPRPYSPPTKNAAFFIPGTITMHCALSRSFKGMPLSRLAEISRNVCALRCKRLSGVSSCARTSGAASNWQATDIKATSALGYRRAGRLTYSIAINRIVPVGLDWPADRVLPANNFVDGLRKLLKFRAGWGVRRILAHRETARHRFGHYNPLPDPGQYFLSQFLQRRGQPPAE